jgi:hypothetical protein
MSSVRTHMQSENQTGNRSISSTRTLAHARNEISIHAMLDKQRTEINMSGRDIHTSGRDVHTMVYTPCPGPGRAPYV